MARMLDLDARAALLVHAVDLYLDALAPDCLSHASLGVSDAPGPSVVIQWHTDGVHSGGLDRRWVTIGGILSDSRGVEALAEEIARLQVESHFIEDHTPPA